MVIIEYAEHGEPVSDFNWQYWLDNVKANIDKDHHFVVSTGIPIHAVRLAICKGEIDHTKIVFKYSNELMQANEYGRIDNWPNGFADRDIAFSEDMLSISMKKIREQKTKF